MTAILVDNQWIYFDGLSEYEDDILWKSFSVSRPNIFVNREQLSEWDGVYRFYNRVKQRIARPFLSMLRGICAKKNLALSIRDKRNPWKYQITPETEINNDFLPGITLDDCQVEGIRTACKTECGIFDVPTAGGKGEYICGICKAINCPTLILADQIVVIDQLKSRLELREVTDNVGLFYAGQRPSGEMIIVGSIQSLSTANMPNLPNRTPEDDDLTYKEKMRKWEISYKGYKTRKRNVKKLHEYVKKSQMIIVDECDRASGPNFVNLFRHVYTGRRRYGFSGTVYDPSKPVEAFRVQSHLGSIIHQVSREHVTNIGRIQSCKFNMIAFGTEGKPTNATMYDLALNYWIVENQKFHKLVAQLCKQCKLSDTDGTVILADRKILGYSLVEALKKIGLKSEFICEETPKKKRREVIKQYERRELNVLIGGKIINRGLDLTGGCENLIITIPGKLQSEFIQKIGRALRKNSRGISNIYSFFYRCNRHLYDHSKIQLKTMVGLNYPTSVVFPGGVVDGKTFCDNHFRITKNLLIKPQQKVLFE